MKENALDLAERYVQRSELLLRLIDPDDLGHLVDPAARAEICRVLKFTEPRNEIAPLQTSPAAV